MEISGSGGATPEMVELFERYIGISLPDDYRSFLCIYNGGVVARSGNYTFSAPGLQEEVPLDVLFGLGISDMDLIAVNDEFREDTLPMGLIVGKDPGGGFIVLVSSGIDRGIYYWDAGHNFPQSANEYDAFKVADSFQEFIDSLRASAEDIN